MRAGTILSRFEQRLEKATTLLQRAVARAKARAGFGRLAFIRLGSIGGRAWRRFCSELHGLREPLRGALTLAKAAGLLGLIALGLGVAALAGVVVTFAMTASAPSARLDAAMDRWAGVELVDRDGCLLGLIAGARDVGPSTFSDGRFAMPDQKVIVLDDAPDGYWRILLALEDGGLGSWRTVPGLGLDWVSSIGAVRDTLSGRLRGASGIPQLLAGTLVTDDPAWQVGRLTRKWAEVRHAAAIYNSHWEGRRSPRFRALAASYLPHAISSRGSRGGAALNGVGVAAHVLWGRTPDQLELWQEAVLAAAVRRPIVLAAETDIQGQEAAARRWETVRERAINGLRRAYGSNHAGARAATAILSEAPLPSPRMCAALEAVAPEDPVERFQVRFNLARRAEYFAAGALPEATRELRDAYGQDFYLDVSRVRLAISGAENVAFQQAVGAQLYRHGRPDIRESDVILAVADARGRLRLIHQLAERPLLHRPRATASVSKVIAALARAPFAALGERYCNRHIDGVLRNSDGDTGVTDCSLPGSQADAHFVFARSASLPVFEMLNRRRTFDLGGLSALAGFDAYPDTPLPTALAFGLGEMSPAEILRLVAALQAGLFDGRAMAALPSVIERVEMRSANEPTPAERDTIDLSPWLPDGAARDFVGSMLAAPLEPFGTARTLGRCRHQIFLAKTGTAASQGRVSARLLAAGSAIDGERIAALAVSAHVNPNGEASRTISGGDLAAALCAGLQAADSQARQLRQFYHSGASPEGAP